MEKCSADDVIRQFERSAENYAAQEEIGQGREGISLFKPLLSRGFQQCSALLLINAANGAVFLKHIGPRPMEVFSGSRGIGEGFQNQYKVFMDAAKEQKIIVISVYGSCSYNREHLVAQVKNDAAGRGCNVEIVQPIFIPSMQSKWQILFDPQKIELHTFHFAEDANGEVKAVALTHTIPKIDASSFTQDSRDEIERRIVHSERLSDIKAELKTSISSGNAEDLAVVLQAAQEKIGALAVQHVLKSELDDWECQTPVQACQSSFAQRYASGGKSSSAGVIDCVEVLTRHDSQDDGMRQKYLACLFNMAGCVKEDILLESIAKTSGALISGIQDPDMLNNYTRRADFFFRANDRQ